MKSTEPVQQFQCIEQESDFWDSHSTIDFEAKEVAVEDILEDLHRRPAKRRVTLSLGR